MFNEYYIIIFEDIKVVWSYKMIILPDLPSRFITPYALQVLNKMYPDNEIEFYCKEMVLYSRISDTTFEILCDNYIATDANPPDLASFVFY
jgi:hypothetical protein